MHLDFSKRLCDVTLGEYIAATQSVSMLFSLLLAVVCGAAGFTWAIVKRRRNARVMKEIALEMEGR